MHHDYQVLVHHCKQLVSFWGFFYSPLKWTQHSSDSTTDPVWSRLCDGATEWCFFTNVHTKQQKKNIPFWPSLKSLTELLVISSSWHGLLLLKLLIWTDGSCSRCWLRWTATLRMFCAVILQMGKTEMKKIICLSELRYILSFWVYEQTQSVDALSLSLPSALKCLQSLTDYQLSEQSWTAARRAVLKLLETVSFTPLIH